ncbi:hypothetical protein P152DRAFT_397605, partial [Eremomyces bilateralis CBS 781.70]
DYCDVYLTHDSMSVRKAHNSGRNHLRNVVDYYNQIGQEQAQTVIDSITNSYAAEGQQASNPLLQAPGGLAGVGPSAGGFPPPFSFPGMLPPSLYVSYLTSPRSPRYATPSLRNAPRSRRLAPEPPAEPSLPTPEHAAGRTTLPAAVPAQ